MRLIDADALIRKYKKIDITDYEPELVEILESVITDLESEPTISTNAEHDGCDGCRYEQNTEHEYPCKDCKQNYMDRWEQKPNDSLSVVRCKDCRHYEDGMVGYCWEVDRGVSGDFFCAYGERREE